MTESIWLGRDEHGGTPSEPRKDLEPPPHWRLEAIAATPTPRSVTLSADRKRAVFIEDGTDFSDVYLLNLDGGAPRRLTTGRAPSLGWEDAPPRLSPDGETVAYTDDGHVWLVPAAGGPQRKLLEGGSPVWIDDDRLVVSVEHDDASRLAVVEVADPWPRPLAEAGEPGDEGSAAVSPDGTRVAYVFSPRADLNRSEIRVASIDGGDSRAVTGTSRMHDRGPAWSPDGQTIAYSSERSGFYELHLVTSDGSEERQLTSAGADHAQPEWHPEGDRILAVRCRGNRFDLVVVEANSGDADTLAEGGTWSDPHWLEGDAAIGAFERHDAPPDLRMATGEALHAPAPLAVRSAPHAKLEPITFESFDGLEIPGFLMRPRGASPDRPAPAIVHPHGGPTSHYGDEWDGVGQYFVDKGYAWLAPNFRGSTGHGREFERRNHGVWGVDDTRDCLAAADYLKAFDWIDPERLGIFGASYGSYMALLAVTDDPEHRFRCAVAKYGDSDILTSWAQGDREGRLDLERMMGGPAQAKDAYRAGSPLRRAENIQAPILIAHGERDDRVNPKQSERLVAELRRLNKTFEYLTFPTEAHGLLRFGPQVHFHRRLERFLDWHLM